METWKDIPDYEDYFMISNQGRMYSKRSNKILKLHTSKKGYVTLSTKIGGRSGTNKCFKIHRLVALAFIDNPYNKPEINHIDGNKLNNNSTNLEWVTGSENVLHAHKIGLAHAKRGTKNKNSKLTNEQVIEIRSRRSNGETCKSLGIEFGVHHMQISRIARNISYKS